jgi:REP element-mobilizing transposase RayT
MSPPTFALLETWTCFGQWLPGERRGYVSNTIERPGYRPKRNEVGTACDRGETATYMRARELQRHETVSLTFEQARVAAQAMIDAAAEREWVILQGAVMANHVHVVVANCPDDGPAVRRVLKGTSQAALSRFAGTLCKWWTTGGSDRYKHGEAAIASAIEYVNNQEFVLVKIVNNEIVEVS